MVAKLLCANLSHLAKSMNHGCYLWNLPMAGFKPLTSSIGSNHSTNWVTTSVPIKPNFLSGDVFNIHNFAITFNKKYKIDFCKLNSFCGLICNFIRSRSKKNPLRLFLIKIPYYVIIDYWGRCCDSVASNNRGPRFKSSHQHILFTFKLGGTRLLRLRWIVVYCKNKEKETGNGPMIKNSLLRVHRA